MLTNQKCTTPSKSASFQFLARDKQTSEYSKTSLNFEQIFHDTNTVYQNFIIDVQ